MEYECTYVLFVSVFFRLLIKPSSCVDVGGIDGQYSVRWLMRWKGVSRMHVVMLFV